MTCSKKNVRRLAIRSLSFSDKIAARAALPSSDVIDSLDVEVGTQSVAWQFFVFVCKEHVFEIASLCLHMSVINMCMFRYVHVGSRICFSTRNCHTNKTPAGKS